MSEKRNVPKLFGFRWTTLAIIAGVMVLGAAALGLDLASEGLVYDYLWEVTGETDPAQQMLGFGQYLVRFTRDQPDTAPMTRVPLADVSPYGVNTFLEQEVELAKREQQVAMIAGAGFNWVRQQFPWEDIEIDGKGDFIDRRHDRDGDEIPDEISSWEKYDNIVDLIEQYDLHMLVRLSAPPAWSQPPGTTNRYTPPTDFQDFVDYAVAVAERYQGRMMHYQVWNEPNLYPEWGEQTVNAEAYTDLLCRTYTALKAVDPDIVVHTGAIGPTIDLSGRNAYDLLYLQRMYQAGAGDCFDVLSVQGYGLWSGPTDQRLRAVTINYARNVWLRDVMVANGDAGKPIWISEAGWNPVPNDPSIANLEQYGRVTMEQAAEWAPLAYDRAIEEWPWVGVVFWWYFKRPNDAESGHSWYYFRLVEPDFSTTPVYDALKAYMTDPEPKVLGAGRHGVQHSGVIHQGESPDDVLYEYRVRGTAVYLCYDAPAESALVSFDIDGEVFDGHQLPAGSAGCVTLCDDLDGGTHRVTVAAPAGTPLLDLVVIDHAARHRLPWLLTGGVAVLFMLIVLGHGVLVRLQGDD